jgi:uncharacterized membrane protein
MILYFGLIGILFVALAIPLVKHLIPPNRFYGLRTSETLENREVWYEANARSGRDLIRGGTGLIIGACLGFMLPWEVTSQQALVGCLLLLIFVVVYAVRGFRIGRDVKREIEQSTDSEGNGTT